MGADGAATLLADGGVGADVHVEVRRAGRRYPAGRGPRRSLRAVLQLRHFLRARRGGRHARPAPAAVERHEPHQRSELQPPAHSQQPHQEIHPGAAQRVLGYEPRDGVAPPRRRADVVVRHGGGRPDDLRECSAFTALRRHVHRRGPGGRPVGRQQADHPLAVPVKPGAHARRRRQLGEHDAPSGPLPWRRGQLLRRPRQPVPHRAAPRSPMVRESATPGIHRRPVQQARAPARHAQHPGGCGARYRRLPVHRRREVQAVGARLPRGVDRPDEAERRDHAGQTSTTTV